MKIFEMIFRKVSITFAIIYEATGLFSPIMPTIMDDSKNPMIIVIILSLIELELNRHILNAFSIIC